MNMPGIQWFSDTDDDKVIYYAEISPSDQSNFRVDTPNPEYGEFMGDYFDIQTYFKTFFGAVAYAEKLVSYGKTVRLFDLMGDD